MEGAGVFELASSAMALCLHFAGCVELGLYLHKRSNRVVIFRFARRIGAELLQPPP
jgi:hypothetical protein